MQDASARNAASVDFPPEPEPTEKVERLGKGRADLKVLSEFV
jgi:hypothetical protein